MPKRVVIVAPDFPPCNLAGVHRSRLFANHLSKFGYEPIVLSVEPSYYESKLDYELMQTISPEVKIVRTKALPIRPVRLLGDMGLRSFWQHYRLLCKMVREAKIDLIYIPIPPNYSALLGPLIKLRFGVPYAIDYIDPWIYLPSAQDKKSCKAMASLTLAHWLEPFAVRKADGISGVASGYFEGVLKRNPHLATVPTLAVPYGGELLDDELVDRTNRRSTTLERFAKPGKKILVYAGAMMPHAHDTFRTLFAGARLLKDSDPNAYESLQFIFIGTGSTLVKEIADEHGITDIVTEVIERQPFLEILALLRRAHGVLILGSNERHYTASKTFQALGSRRPILAMLHQESSAAEILGRASGVELVGFTESALVKKEETHQALRAILRYDSRENFERTAILKDFSAEAMTAKLAKFFDLILGSKETPA